MRAFLAICVLLVAASTASAAVLVVDSTGQTPGSYPSFEDALDVAEDGDEIVIGEHEESVAGFVRDINLSITFTCDNLNHFYLNTSGIGTTIRINGPIEIEELFIFGRFRRVEMNRVDQKINGSSWYIQPQGSFKISNSVVKSILDFAPTGSGYKIEIDKSYIGHLTQILSIDHLRISSSLVKNLRIPLSFECTEWEIENSLIILSNNTPRRVCDRWSLSFEDSLFFTDSGRFLPQTFGFEKSHAVYPPSF